MYFRISQFFQEYDWWFYTNELRSYNNKIFEVFYDDYESGKGFMHSNTYTGNAISAAASLATINYYEGWVLLRESQKIVNFFMIFLRMLQRDWVLCKMCSCGFVVAADLDTSLKV